jgi:hypothetical protein
MKVRDVLKLTKQNLIGTARSAAADRTATIVAPVQIPNRIVGRHERPGSQDIFPDADANHDVTDDLSLAPDPSPTSPVRISPANRRDLDFIRTQLARLPRHIEQ